MARFTKVENFDSVRAFRRSLAASDVNFSEPLNFDGIKSQWIFSVTGDHAIPLKIEWLNQDFAAAIKQKQIDIVIDAHPHDVIEATVEGLMKLENHDCSVEVPIEPQADLYISLKDMLRSLDTQVVHESNNQIVINLVKRYNLSLKAFFKVFDLEELKSEKIRENSTLDILEWIFENIRSLKTQGITALLIDGLTRFDELRMDAIALKLEAIQSHGLPLCFVQSSPLQILKIIELGSIIPSFFHITFVLQGLVPENNKNAVSLAQKKSVKAEYFRLNLDRKRKIYQKVSLSFNQLFYKKNIYDTEAYSAKIRKIFNLKLSGLSASQIAKILLAIDFPKFESIKQNGIHNEVNFWNLSIVLNVLDALYVFEDNLEPSILKKSLSLDSDCPLKYSEVISENIYCLAMQPFLTSNLNTRHTQVKIKNLLMHVLNSRIFCACDAHQEFLHRVKDKNLLSYFFSSSQKICNCSEMVVNEDSFEDCMTSAMLALALKAPQTSNLVDILKNELDWLTDTGKKITKNSSSTHEKEKNTDDINSSIEIISKKLRWLSNPEIELRLHRFCEFFQADTLDNSKAIEFIELTQQLITSAFLDVNTGFIKIYWSHSLTASEINIGKVVKYKTGVVIMDLFSSANFVPNLDNTI